MEQRNRPQNIISLEKKCFDCVLNLTLLEAEKESIEKFLTESSHSRFEKLCFDLWHQIEPLSSLPSIHIYFPTSEFGTHQYEFLLKLFGKMSTENVDSLNLVSFPHLLEFLYANFIQNTSKTPPQITLINRFFLFSENETLQVCLNNLVHIISVHFPKLKEFVFAYYILSSDVTIKKVQNVLEKTATTLEKIVIFLRIAFLRECMPLFDAIKYVGQFNKLKSLRIAFEATYSDNQKILSVINENFESLFENHLLNSLKDFGISFHSFLEIHFMKRLFKVLSYLLPQLNSFVCFFQPFYEELAEDDLQNLLELLLLTKAENLRNFSLGIYTGDSSKFILETFCHLFKECKWNLLKLSLFWVIKQKRKEMSQFLSQIIMSQKYLMELDIEFSFSGINLVKHFGLSEILTKYFFFKKRLVIKCWLLGQKLRKLFRIEIVNQVLDKFICINDQAYISFQSKKKKEKKLKVKFILPSFE